MLHWCEPCTAAGAIAPQRVVRAGRSSPAWHCQHAHVRRRIARCSLRETQRGRAACGGAAGSPIPNRIVRRTCRATCGTRRKRCRCRSAARQSPGRRHPPCARGARRGTRGHARTREAAAHGARLQAGRRDAPQCKSWVRASHLPHITLSSHHGRARHESIWPQLAAMQGARPGCCGDQDRRV